MSVNLAIAVAVILIFMMILIINNVKKGKLQLAHSVFWLVTGAITVILLLIPNCIFNITKLLGFEVPSNMVFFITIVLLFYLVLQLMIALSKESKRNVNLVQELSMLKKKIEDIEKNNKS